jgi:hypothetical protein
MTDKPERVRQCKTCPWKVGADPVVEIPGYKRGLHCRLTDTIASGSASLTGPLRVMACHYSKTGAETACAGWLDNQLGPGNNFAVRLAVMRGQLPVPVVDGPQHPTLEATIPRPGRRRGRR